MYPCHATYTGKNSAANRRNPSTEWSATSWRDSSVMATTNTRSKNSSSHDACLGSASSAAVRSRGGTNQRSRSPPATSALIQELHVPADLVEPQRAVPGHGPVVGIGHQEDEIAALRPGLLHGARHDRAGVPAVAVLVERPHVLDLPRSPVGVQVSEADDVPARPNGQEAGADRVADPPLRFQELLHHLGR